MSDKETQHVGVQLTRPEADVLWWVCQWLEEDPSRIGRLYLERLSAAAKELEREYAGRLQKVGATACEKLGRAISERFGQDASGPLWLVRPEGPEKGGAR